MLAYSFVLQTVWYLSALWLLFSIKTHKLTILLSISLSIHLWNHLWMTFFSAVNDGSKYFKEKMAEFLKNETGEAETNEAYYKLTKIVILKESFSNKIFVDSKEFLLIWQFWLVCNNVILFQQIIVLLRFYLNFQMRFSIRLFKEYVRCLQQLTRKCMWDKFLAFNNVQSQLIRS